LSGLKAITTIMSQTVVVAWVRQQTSPAGLNIGR
jgi:hypothetical protein